MRSLTKENLHDIALITKRLREGKKRYSLKQVEQVLGLITEKNK